MVSGNGHLVAKPERKEAPDPGSQANTGPESPHRTGVSSAAKACPLGCSTRSPRRVGPLQPRRDLLHRARRHQLLQVRLVPRPVRLRPHPILRSHPRRSCAPLADATVRWEPEADPHSNRLSAELTKKEGPILLAKSLQG